MQFQVQCIGADLQGSCHILHLVPTGADEKRRAEHDKRAEKSDAAGTVPVWDAAACTKPGGAQLVRRH